MIRSRLETCLESPRLPAAASFVSLALGLVFVFLWAPHPWGWFGIDQYHQIAIDLANGQPFPTIDVPWGYGYFLALFYRIFGPSPAPALVAQVVLNALIPLLVYRIASREFDRRVAALATCLVAVLSFNTVYASTEASDSVCTFLFMLMLWSFVEARHRERWSMYIATGVLLGLAAQFRPNLLLLPAALAAFHVVGRRFTWRSIGQGMSLGLVAAVMLAPWVLRNYRLTGEFIPTSTHGGVQLWYGSLETGPYLTSRAHNPRRLFETPAFDYTSLKQRPVIFDVAMTCPPGRPDEVTLVYRTDGGPAERRVRLTEDANRHWHGEVPALARDGRLYYWLEARWPDGVTSQPVRSSPPGGAADPFVYFISSDHVGDLDVDGALWDVFDVTRLLRHMAWQEPVPPSPPLDRDGDGHAGEADLRALLQLMLTHLDRDQPPIDRLSSVRTSDSEVRAVFIDGTALVVPRTWNGLLTDLRFEDGVSSALLGARRRVAESPAPYLPMAERCLAPGESAINTPFYRVQPHEMRRYTALALDNIRRDPLAYAWSVLYRSVRLFVIMGSDDRGTAHQFDNSRVVYLLGTVASGGFFLLFLAGAWIGWRRGYAVTLPLFLIATLPASIAFVLINMRYTITVQPLILTFAAVSLLAIWDATWRREPRTGRA
jgi:multisubunit Na+/H+ antiporter MnhF subunit